MRLGAVHPRELRLPSYVAGDISVKAPDARKAPALGTHTGQVVGFDHAHVCRFELAQGAQARLEADRVGRVHEVIGVVRARSETPGVQATGEQQEGE